MSLAERYRADQAAKVAAMSLALTTIRQLCDAVPRNCPLDGTGCACACTGACVPRIVLDAEDVMQALTGAISPNKIAAVA